MDNYQISRDRAQAFFLGFDQEAIIAEWKLTHEKSWLYVDFLGRPYRIDRKTGEIWRIWDGKQAGFGETLSIFDLLCHEGAPKYPSGRFAPVNSLKGGPRAVGVGTSFHEKTAARFDECFEAFRRACRNLGADELPMADAAYRFALFGDLQVILKFYHGDEEFPASVTLLWDDHTLMYMFYETVFYTAGCLMDAILTEMEETA